MRNWSFVHQNEDGGREHYGEIAKSWVAYQNHGWLAEKVAFRVSLERRAPRKMRVASVCKQVIICISFGVTAKEFQYPAPSGVHLPVHRRAESGPPSDVLFFLAC